MAYLSGGISARKGCYYVLAQLAGAFLGALVVTFDYVIFKGGDQLTNFYCTAPRDGYSASSWANCFYDELVASTCPCSLPPLDPPCRLRPLYSLPRILCHCYWLLLCKLADLAAAVQTG